ncbi:hypothetical protein [Mycolicibacterium canariasense]|uniref:hypothetical protein n=1 Tax=Mycolicibacterium canariasense TaxID=228230 RepID=UPI000787DA5F|nr:hypothetical protein [Mycolicibacterium canariasense]MCV7212060.1 hypothetical protein [Mycolicibacterium canariasense]ORV04149.1 hypothetical protein AWB94_23030 [Mycolicibacterium canariasense]
MDSDTRRNVVVFYLNFVVLAVVGLVVNPLLLGALGPVMFGIWKSLQRYLDFATVADGRASQALKWIVASRAALGDEERRRDIGAAITVWLRWLAATVTVSIGVTAALPFLIKGIPSHVMTMVYWAAALLALNTVLAGFLSIPDAVLAGINQGYKSMLVTTFVFVISNGALLAAAVSDWPLWSLAVIVLLAGVANAALTLLVAKRSVTWWGVSRPTASDLRRVFGYSAWTLGSVVVDKLLLASELIVISVAVGAVTVAQYTFTTYVTQFVLALALVTASGFTPILGSLLGASEFAAAAERARSARHLVIGVTVLGSAAVLAFNGVFVTVWAGADQYLGTTVNALLAVCGMQQALIRMDGQVLDVTMRIGPKVVIGLISSIGGIIAGIIGYSLTHDLRASLIAVILLRLIGNIAYPALVARSIPGSSVPVRTLVLACILLGGSLAIGAAAQGGGATSLTGFAVLWAVLAVGTAWCGLLPRSTVRALLAHK